MSEDPALGSASGPARTTAIHRSSRRVPRCASRFWISTDRLSATGTSRPTRRFSRSVHSRRATSRLRPLVSPRDCESSNGVRDGLDDASASRSFLRRQRAQQTSASEAAARPHRDLPLFRVGFCFARRSSLRLPSWPAGADEATAVAGPEADERDGTRLARTKRLRLLRLPRPRLRQGLVLVRWSCCTTALMQ